MPDDKEMTAPIDEKGPRRKDGKYRFAVWDSEGKCTHPKAIKGCCLTSCPAKFKDSGRKVNKYFLDKPDEDGDLGWYVTCHAEWIK